MPAALVIMGAMLARVPVNSELFTNERLFILANLSKIKCYHQALLNIFADSFKA